MDHDRPQYGSYDELAQVMEQALVDPALTEDQVRDGCLMAIEYAIGALIVRPCDIDIAQRSLRGSAVALGSVVGFPHGTQNTATKLYEARDLIRRGVKQLDVVVNPSKLIARQWIYVETEMLQLAQAAKEEGVRLTAILEMPILPEEQKIVACRICKRAAVDFIATGTGYSGRFSAADLALLVRKCEQWIGVKAAGSIGTLDDVLMAHAQGATRFTSRNVEAILQAWKKRLSERPAGATIS